MTLTGMSQRAQEIASDQLVQIRIRTNRIFAGLMVLQLFAVVCGVWWISPLTWSGTEAQTHIHVYASIVLGSLIAALPIALVLAAPHRYSTQIVISIAQAMFSALIIHMSGGRIETHFHVFGSLAFLAFYRDWKTLLPATVVVAVDHFWRGIFWPESVFGVLTAAPWRAVEHALWVVFIDVFLVYSCVTGKRDVGVMAARQADLEAHSQVTEREVAVRTQELADSEAFQRAILDSQSAHIAILNARGDIIGINEAWRAFWEANGATPEEYRDINYLEACETATGMCSGEAQNMADAIREVLGGRSRRESIIYPCHGPVRKRWFRADITSLQCATGGAVIAHHDITNEVSRNIELEQLQQRLEAETVLLDAILEAIPFQVYWKGTELKFDGCNSAFSSFAGCSSRSEVIGGDERDLANLDPGCSEMFVDDAAILKGAAPVVAEERDWTLQSGQTRSFLVSKLPIRVGGKVLGVAGIFVDVTERKQLENQLAQSQRLESIGQLAAGIAHEINTPAQYVGDNTRFLRGEFGGLIRVLDKYAAKLDKSGPKLSWDERLAEVEATLKEVDYEFLRVEIPQALEQSLEGIERIASIVLAMKEFSHPGSSTLEPADLNRAIESTITVCSNRWKDAADVELDLDPTLPLVPCMVSDFNQVILNLVVNAADAIAEQDRGGEKGRIVVSSSMDAHDVLIVVADDGAGIPADVRSKIFDPFFTTKEVGKGTGQGLAISRDVVVQKHGGTIECESTPGEGTRFLIRLPLGGTKQQQREVA